MNAEKPRFVERRIAGGWKVWDRETEGYVSEHIFDNAMHAVDFVVLMLKLHHGWLYVEAAKRNAHDDEFEETKLP